MHDKILLRFNNKPEPGSPFIWRVFVNDEEFAATSFRLIGELYPIISYEGDVKKYNVGCLGTVTWEDTKAIIKSV
jgi:hypothetical protein